MPDVGLSFSPTSAPSQYGGAQGNRTGSPSSPVMDAIKILSFRVPQTLGQGAPIAQPFLAGTGGAGPSGIDNSALVLQWLNRFFGGGLSQAGPTGLGAPPSSAPSGPFGGDLGAGAPVPPSDGGHPAFTFPASRPPSGTTDLATAIARDDAARASGTPTAFTNTAPAYSPPGAFTATGPAGVFVPSK